MWLLLLILPSRKCHMELAQEHRRLKIETRQSLKKSFNISYPFGTRNGTE